ncbi:DNA cytosine methyltransferase [Leucobacter aridicollis]|uniref:DNA cytosine methyltransferase n=1 Tax=Leucobacter aridicollis TaxID=283878 RepID=UPI0021685D4F|nr:DNA cytosine methyltransferase [Leucobacter aridicollis]MCS3426717.1 DNA (cytosine-5)-methyltransferase 1 [Leucobacter aridicollis]
MAIQFLDFFAGFGGASSGLVEAGFELVTAYNHWDKAIEVHSANHSDADHVQGDLSGYDMRRLPWAPVLWASPECTWHSPAGGRKRVRASAPTLFGDDPLPADAGVRSRATMYDPIRAAEARSFDVVVIENVVEVASWPLFDPWLRMWEALGYSWKIVNVNAAHVYSDTNAAAGQWRDRIYVVLTRKGVTPPALEPAPPAYCHQCGRDVTTRQHWKKPGPDGAPRVGKYGQQYVYVCDAGAHALQVVEPFVLPAAAVIDWTDLGIRIGDREKLGMRPLAAATMRRIEVGLRMFARPAIVGAAGQTWDAANPRHPRFGEHESYYRAWDSLAPLNARQAGGSGDGVAVPPHMIAVNHDGDARARRLDAGPVPTRSTKIGDGFVFPPYLMDKYDYSGGDDRRVRAVETPIGTVTASPHAMLSVPPFVSELYGTGTARGVEDTALSAVTAGGNHHGVTVPPDAFLSRQYGGSSMEHLNTSVARPTHPITASGGGNHALVVPERKRPACRYEGDLPFALDDVRFRMLGPREHLRAQRFADDYDTSAANKSETTKGAGNAVAVNVAHWIGASVLEALG